MAAKMREWEEERVEARRRLDAEATDLEERRRAVSLELHVRWCCGCWRNGRGITRVMMKQGGYRLGARAGSRAVSSLTLTMCLLFLTGAGCQPDAPRAKAAG